MPTASFIARTIRQTQNTGYKHQQKLCLFCEESDHPNTCKNVRDVEKRVEIIKRKRVCFNCFGNHRVVDCKSEFKCKQCGKKNHTSICKEESKKTQSQNENQPRKTVVHAHVTKNSWSRPLYYIQLVTYSLMFAQN